MNSEKQSFYVLVVNYNSSVLVSRLITSILTQEKQPKQIIVINNSPEDKKIEQLENERVLILQAKTNLGFGKACNLGLNWIYKNDANGIVWLINPDAYLVENSLQKAKQFFLEHPEITILGTEVYEPDGKLWFGWGRFNKRNGLILSMKEPLNYDSKPYSITDWVTGCSLFINLNKFTECPYFDPDYFLYYEDCELCQRYAQQGHLIAVTNQIKIIHEPSSITEKYGNLKLTHNIYSYLLSLEKYTHPLILCLRFLRMIFMSMIILPFKPKFARGKLKGIWLYIQKRFSDKKKYVRTTD